MTNKTKPLENTDFAAIGGAAHTLARKTKTPCYIWQDGIIIDSDIGAQFLERDRM